MAPRTSSFYSRKSWLTLAVALAITYLVVVITTSLNGLQYPVVRDIFGVIAITGLVLHSGLFVMMRLFPRTTHKLLGKPVIRPRWERRADRLINAGRYDQANQLLEPLERHPDRRVAFRSQLARANLLYRQGNWTESERLFCQATEACRGPGLVYVLAVRGLCRWHLDDHEQAEQVYRSAAAARDALRQADSSARQADITPDTQGLLALLAWRLQLWPEALDEFQRLSGQRPKDELARRCLALLYAAAPDPTPRDGNKSLQYALQLPDGWRTFSIIAAAYAECGNFQQAVDWARKTYDAAPEQEKPARLKRLRQYQGHEPYRLDQDQTA